MKINVNALPDKLQHNIMQIEEHIKNLPMKTYIRYRYEDLAKQLKILLNYKSHNVVQSKINICKNHIEEILENINKFETRQKEKEEQKKILAGKQTTLQTFTEN